MKCGNKKTERERKTYRWIFRTLILTLLFCGVTSSAQMNLFGDIPTGVISSVQMNLFKDEPFGTISYAQTNPFADVSSDTYYFDAVQWALEQDITTGTSATTFSPNEGCKRGQVVTFLWRAAGKPSPSSTANVFRDVPKDAYYSDAVLWAKEKEITSGTDDTHFSPDATCTRAQIVTFYGVFRERKKQTRTAAFPTSQRTRIMQKPYPGQPKKTLPPEKRKPSSVPTTPVPERRLSHFCIV